MINRSKKSFGGTVRFFSEAYILATGLSPSPRDEMELNGYFELYLDIMERTPTEDGKVVMQALVLVPEAVLCPVQDENTSTDHGHIYNPEMEDFMEEETLKILKERMTWLSGEPFEWEMGEGPSVNDEATRRYSLEECLEILNWKEERVRFEKKRWEKKQLYRRFGL